MFQVISDLLNMEIAAEIVQSANELRRDIQWPTGS